MHSRKQLGQIERLGEIIVRAFLQATNSRVELVARGQHENRSRDRARAECGHDAKTVPTGKHDVEKDARIASIERELQSPVAGIRLIHGESFLAERLAQKSAKISVIFDNENLHVALSASAFVGHKRVWTLGVATSMSEMVANWHELGFIVDKGLGKPVETEKTNVCKSCFFINIRPEISKDEAQALIDSAQHIEDAFYVVVQGLAWLSADTRVFKLQPGGKFAHQTMQNDANAFIKAVIDSLRGSQQAGSWFDNLPSDETGAELEWSQNINGQPVYNFAVCRVRYRAELNAALDVRVFFRLFPAMTTSTDFQPATTYRTGGQPGTKIPLLGIVGGEVATIPFFAEARRAAGDNLNLQQDPHNIDTLQINAGGGETYSKSLPCRGASRNRTGE